MIIISQFVNIYISYKITKKIFSYLILIQIVMLANMVGCIFLESTIYDNNSASLYLIIFSFLLNIGASLHNFVSKKKPVYSVNLESKLYQNDLYNQNISKYHFITIATIISQLTAISFFIIYGIPLLAGNPDLARIKFQEFGSSNIYYRVFLYVLPTLTIATVPVWKTLNRNKVKWFLIYSFSFTTGILLFLGYKGYVLWFVILMCMTLNIYLDNSAMLRIGILLITIGISIGVIVTTLTIEGDLVEGFYKLIERATTISSKGYAILIYEFIPVDINENISVENNLNRYLAVWKYGEKSKMAMYSLSLTVTIVGSLIYYFGIYGMMIISIIIGFVLQHIYYIVFSYMMNPILTAILIQILFTFVGVSNRGLTENFIYQPMLTILAMLTTFIFSIGVLNRKLKFIFYIS